MQEVAPSDPVLPLPTRRATRRLARALARRIEPGDLVILSGALGAGKTFLTRAFCRALGLPSEARVTSPTFALIHQLPTEPPVAHADLYRLASSDGLDDLGLRELRERGCVLVVEWGERFEQALGGDGLTIALSLEPRRARLGASGPRGAALRAAIVAELAAEPRPLITDRSGSQ